MQKNNNKNKIKGIKTFHSDMAELVKDGGTSMADIVIAEKRKRSNKNPEKKKNVKKKNFSFLFLSILLIILALGGTKFLIKKGIEKSKTDNIQEKVESLVPYDDQSIIDTSNIISKNELAEIINLELKKSLEAEKIKNIVLGNPIESSIEILNTSEFLKLSKIFIPETLSNSLKEDYMLGAFTPETNQRSLFLIFQTKDYGSSLAGVSEWEKTMLSNLYPIFGINISGKEKLLTKPFEDIIISNRDARVLTDDEGNNLLYYSFINNNIFVITDN
ncbi:MAG: hypothetical protein U9R00_02130, partial [Patescibacteria group bacterium]|nr:hypothetical protein [Patescibacteria group bacterium]